MKSGNLAFIKSKSSQVASSGGRLDRIHDLVHDFCLLHARKEKFFDRISSTAPSSSSDLMPISSTAPSSSSDLMPRIATFDYHRRLIGLNNFVLISSNKEMHFGKHLYSLFITGDKKEDHLSDPCHLRHLRLLRVFCLHFSFIKVNHSLLNEICMLNHLRYLSIGTQVKSLPLSFSNLSNLETLVVKTDGSPLVLLPTIWYLVKLRTLCGITCSFFDMDTDEPILVAEDTKLENLTFLSELVLSYSKDTEHIFKRFPNLQELVLVLKESWDYSIEKYWFPKLDFMSELKVLKVQFKSSNSDGNQPSVVTSWLWDFHFPLNLKELWLSFFPLTSDAFSTIARLPNLEELTLIDSIIQGEEWNVGEEDTFENLKILRLFKSNLAKWDVREESLPVLEKLQLWRCHKLEEIPPSLGDICSLKIIKLFESPQLEDSAKNIKEYVEDMGDEFQILGPNNIPLFK